MKIIKMGKLHGLILLSVCVFLVRVNWFSPEEMVREFVNSNQDFYITINRSTISTSFRHPLTGHIQHRHILGIGLDQFYSFPQSCIATSESGDPLHDVLRMDLPDAGRLTIELLKMKVDRIKCYEVKWFSTSKKFNPMDCFSLEGAHWYGGAEVFTQRWPINDQRSQMQPYLTGDYLTPEWKNHPEYGKYGPILEPYWISSTGLGIHVYENVALHSSLNADGDGRLCLKGGGDWKGYFGLKRDGKTVKVVLQYTICQGENILDIHRYMSTKFLPQAKSFPDELTIRFPIWSTWARYKVNVNQSLVVGFAREINDHGFPRSQLEIDDMYSTRYGQFDFSPTKFPEPRAMISELHNLGYRVTTWVTPFANLDSQAFLFGAQNDFWMRSPWLSVPGLTRWWQGMGGILDVTNAEAVEWYNRRLRQFMDETGVHAFKFDAGEVSFVPRGTVGHFPLVNANHWTDSYVRLAARFGGTVEVRSGFRSQDVPVFFRMLDKDSVWGQNNGFRTIIPTALCLSVIGYNFILPDMIGGNGYEEDSPFQTTSLPGRELYIRWLQLTAFLPAMQFSIVPWQYDDEVVRIAKKYVQLHETLVAPEILKAAGQLLKTGDPVIRPLWSIDQTEESLTIDSQFLIGDSILVAPIVDQGPRSRDVYLPGTPADHRWKNHATGESFFGGRWVRNVSAALDETPIFIRA